MGVITSDLDIGSHKILNVLPATNSNDVVVKSQLDAVSATIPV